MTDDLHINPFEKIDTNKVAEDLHIVEDSQRNARRGRPALDSAEDDLDPTERKVIGLIEGAQAQAQQTCESELKAYRERLVALDFREQLSSIDIETAKQRAEFDQHVDKAIVELSREQQGLRRKKEDMQQFKEQNGLHREPQPRSWDDKIFNIGIIAVLFLIETFGNASFLAKGNEFGLFGAYTEAVVISFVNLGLAFLLGILVTNFNHIHWGRRSVGIISAAVFIVFALFFNLMVAHYRETTGTVLDEGGKLAIAAFGENPLGLGDFQSWILFFMGFLFAIISFIDGILWDDRYPGYAKGARVFAEADDAYNEFYQACLKGLKKTSDDAVQALENIKQNILLAGRQHDSIIDDHRRLIKSFDDHLEHLEHAGNHLLQLYRDTNRAMRDGEAPERFKKPWSIVKTPVDTSLPKAMLTREEILKITSAAEIKIDKGVADLHNQYDMGSEELRPLAPHRRQPDSPRVDQDEE